MSQKANRMGLASPGDIDIEMGGSAGAHDVRDLVQEPRPRRASQGGGGGGSTFDLITQALFTGTVPAAPSPRAQPRGSIDRGSVDRGSMGRGGNVSGKENAPPVETFYCGICLENQAVGDMFEVSSCDQKQSHKFCTDCVEGFVISQVNSAATIVSCPGFQPGCNGVIETDAIRAVVQRSGDDTLTAKFERFLAMSKSENFRECPRALADGSGLCNHPCTTATVLNPKIVCQKCEYEYCFIHSNAHPEEQCEVYSKRVLKEEQTNQKFIDDTTKHCPACHAATYKNGGCNHMSCQRCNADWCWLCNKEMKGGGGGVTEHYQSGECANKQFTWDGEGTPPLGSILLIYRCLGVEDPDTLSPQIRMVCALLNLALVVSINILSSICILPIFFIGLALGIICCPCIACVFLEIDNWQDGH